MRSNAGYWVVNARNKNNPLGHKFPSFTDSSLIFRFRPSPCPAHYGRRLATMPSADYCLITTEITPHRAVVCHRVRSFPADGLPERQGLFYTRTSAGSRRPPVKQFSPDKDMNCHCTTASFTLSVKPRGFAVLCQLAFRLRLL